MAPDEKKRVWKADYLALFQGDRSPSYTIISESGLYRLVMRSDKAVAREFQDWVTRTVLPAIRKDGGYIMGEEKVASGELSEDEFVLRSDHHHYTIFGGTNEPQYVILWYLRHDNEEGPLVGSHYHNLERMDWLP